MRRLPLSTGHPDASSLLVVEGPAGRLLLIVPPPADERTSARAPETPPEQRPEDHLLRLAEQIVLLPYFRQPQAPYRVVNAQASVAPKAPPPSTQ